jgi:hypothetical protein
VGTPFESQTRALTTSLDAQPPGMSNNKLVEVASNPSPEIFAGAYQPAMSGAIISTRRPRKRRE